MGGKLVNQLLVTLTAIGAVLLFIGFFDKNKKDKKE